MQEQLAKYKAELRAKLGAGTDTIPALNVTYKCEACEDRGFVRNDIEDHTHPLFGKLVACPACQKVKGAGESSAPSGLHPQDYLRNWDDLLELDNHNLKPALRAVKSALVDGYGWVYLWGDYGLGKTDILKTAVARCIQRGIHARYAKGQALMNAMYQAVQEKEFPAVYREFTQVPVLCVDEFEKVSLTDWGMNQRFLLFDDRYDLSLVGQGVTIMASNIAPEEIQDRALRDRVMDERFVRLRLTGTSVRLVSKQLGDRNGQG